MGVKKFIKKSLSVFRLGRTWVQELLSKLGIAAFGNTYVETVNPSQADTFHREIKWSDERSMKRGFELGQRRVRKVSLDTNSMQKWKKKMVLLQSLL